MTEDNKISQNIPPKKIKWIINEICNFKCDYCGIWRNDKKSLKPVDIDKLKKGLDKLTGQWFFCIVGGEPFLEKNFVEICQVITKQHNLGIITNLSTLNVINFADRISPAKCTSIITSVHITEREKRDDGLRSYIERMLYLQNKGFNTSADYVVHPVLFDRIKSDFDFFRSNGIKNVNIKMFIGKHNGKSYPSAYSTEQKILIENLKIDRDESEIMNIKHENFHGNLCYAGQRFFLMDRTGNLKRCSGVLKNYGNLFDHSVKYDTEIKPCPTKKNACLHECVECSIDKKGSIIQRLKEDLIENSLCIKQGINRKSSILKKVICNPRLLNSTSSKRKNI